VLASGQFLQSRAFAKPANGACRRRRLCDTSRRWRACVFAKPGLGGPPCRGRSGAL
jgi:hypothetical protein